MKGFAGIFILIGILILLGVIGGAYYLGTRNKSLSETVSEQNPVILPATSEPNNKPNPDTSPVLNKDETANWKTYLSNSYGYFIKYPPTVTQETKTIKEFPTQVDNTAHDYFTVEGGILEIYGVCGRGVQPIQQASIVIGGQKAIKLYETNTSGVITAILRPNSKESICFNFKLPDDPIKTQSTDALFDKILSTFKFL